MNMGTLDWDGEGFIIFYLDSDRDNTGIGMALIFQDYKDTN